MSAPHPPPPGVSEEAWSKNRLQQYTQRASMPLPVYQTYCDGSPQAPTFRTQVWVDGMCFTSPNSFSNKKMAERDAAKHALIGILEKVKSEGSSRVLQDTIFCKSIIHEYAAKMNLTPTYVTNQSEAMLPIFVSSLVLNGVSYVGDAGKTKREAEQFAARSAILSILGSEYNTTMSEIVKSKFKLYDALEKVKDLYSAHSTDPARENSLKDIKDSCEVQAGNTPAGVNALEAPSSVNKRKEVHVSGGTTGPSIAIPQSSLLTQLPTTQVELRESTLDQPTNTQVTGQSHHEFKKPRCQTSLAAIAPPIVFVRPASAHGLIWSDSLTQLPTAQLELPEPTYQPSNTQVTGQSFHWFKKPGCQTTLAAIAPPIVFVPPSSGQGQICSASGKNRNRKKKKAKKKMELESPLPIVLVSQRPLPACSVAQSTA